MKSLPSELWNSPVIRKRLYAEACFETDLGISDKKFYWCMVPLADSKDGVQVLKNFEESLSHADPHEDQQAFAHKIMGELQQQAHFNGLWLVGFTHPPTTYGTITDTDNCWGRSIFIWFDEDGDPQYTLESDLPFIKQLAMGAQYYVGLAQQAHQSWKEMYGAAAMKQDMMLKEAQSSRAALEALK
jgi:hypothetical protein